MFHLIDSSIVFFKFSIFLVHVEQYHNTMLCFICARRLSTLHFLINSLKLISLSITKVIKINSFHPSFFWFLLFFFVIIFVWSDFVLITCTPSLIFYSFIFSFFSSLLLCSSSCCCRSLSISFLCLLMLWLSLSF